VLTVIVPDPTSLEPGGRLGIQLRRLAALAAELITTKTQHGDTIVRLRRRAEMGLAAEMQWSLLPPLTFSCASVSIAAALEPAYEVAGDSVDYAVDAGMAHFAVFDGMGHGLDSARLATLAVAAYRNARRAGRSLNEIATAVDGSLNIVYNGDAFTTGVLAELNTDTGVLRWINAGHPDPLLLRGHRLVKSLHAEPSFPFGLGRALSGEATRYVASSEQLEPGDRAFLYTDGVIEARSPEGEFFTTSRLADLILQHLASGLTAAEVMRRVVRSVLDHQQGQLDDDASMLLAEWHDVGAPVSVSAAERPAD
jgi:serine phosphatase RsbU (regulator of sigma subunit)